MAIIPSRPKRTTTKQREAVAVEVIARSRGQCECCLGRPGQSIKSVGGKVSVKNSMHVCGSGTTGCHGLLQTHQLIPTLEPEGYWTYAVNPRNRTTRAARWLDGGFERFDRTFKPTGGDGPTHRMAISA